MNHRRAFGNGPPIALSPPLCEIIAIYDKEIRTCIRMYMCYYSQTQQYIGRGTLSDFVRNLLVKSPTQRLFPDGQAFKRFWMNLLEEKLILRRAKLLREGHHFFPLPNSQLVLSTIQKPSKSLRISMISRRSTLVDYVERELSISKTSVSR